MSLTDGIRDAINRRDISALVGHLAGQFTIPPLSKETPVNEPIKPIETHYAGCRFRSRLEARWAVFFDKLGIRWEYEPQGYVVKGKPYLPDFVLPDLKASVEVKGDPERLDLDLLADALDGTRDVLFTLILGPIPDMDTMKVPTHALLAPAFDVRGNPHTFEIIQNYGLALEKIQDPEVKTAVDAMASAYRLHSVTLTRAVFIANGPDVTFLSIWLPFASKAEVLNPSTVWPIVSIPKVQDAYRAARSARFEHGERG